MNLADNESLLQMNIFMIEDAGEMTMMQEIKNMLVTSSEASFRL